VAITFDPHPAEALGGGRRFDYLQSISDRVGSLLSYGVNAVLLIRFTKEIADLTAVEFIERELVDGAGMSHLAIGADFRFGRGRVGDVALLKESGKKNGFQVEVVSPVVSRGELVSSTLVRRSIGGQGDFLRVRELLGKLWSFRGRVVHGQKLGRQLGFPTANLDLGNIVVPKAGVYAVWAKVAGSDVFLPAVMNVGTRPTVDVLNHDRKIEVHLLSQGSFELYETELLVMPVKRLRDELRFDGLEMLKEQIQKDCLEARAQLELQTDF